MIFVNLLHIASPFSHCALLAVTTYLSCLSHSSFRDILQRVADLAAKARAEDIMGQELTKREKKKQENLAAAAMNSATSKLMNRLAEAGAGDDDDDDDDDEKEEEEKGGGVSASQTLSMFDPGAIDLALSFNDDQFGDDDADDDEATGATVGMAGSANTGAGPAPATARIRSRQELQAQQLRLSPLNAASATSAAAAAAAAAAAVGVGAGAGSSASVSGSRASSAASFTDEETLAQLGDMLEELLRMRQEQQLTTAALNAIAGTRTDTNSNPPS